MQICAMYLIHDETAQVANLEMTGYMFHYIFSLSLSLFYMSLYIMCMVVRHHGTRTKLMVIV